MKVDLRKFVDIDIHKHIESIISGNRDTVVLFTNKGTSNTVNIISNMTEANETYSSEQTILNYLDIFFKHSGNKVAVYEGYNTITKNDIINLPDNYICIASTNVDLKTLANEVAIDDTIYGIKDKLFFSRISSIEDSVLNAIPQLDNYAVKYSTVEGSEMTMLAYLCKINTHKPNTVYDYAFTEELIDPQDELSTTNFDKLMTKNINVDLTLSNAVRNCGGNCTNGEDLTNRYVRIVLQQTLTDQLIQTLSQKLKSNTGIGKLYSTVTREMNYYLLDGYLTNDKIWTDDSLVINRNNEDYLIIEKGTPLLNGYYVKILPMSSLTNDEKLEHKSPLIYLIVADQYSIRKITINGEVI